MNHVFESFSQSNYVFKFAWDDDLSDVQDYLDTVSPTGHLDACYVHVEDETDATAIGLIFSDRIIDKAVRTGGAA